MKAFKYRISRQALITYYFGLIRPIVEYDDLLFYSCTKALSDMIEEIQLEAAQTATGAKRRSSHAALYFELGWISLYNKCKMHKMCKLYTILNHLTPKYLSDTLQFYQTPHRYSTCTAANPVPLKYPTANKEPYRKSYFISSIQSWNKLSSSITNSPSLLCFKMRLKKNSNTTQPLFNHNIPRHAQIGIAQLIIGFSDLNSHLFEKGCCGSPRCSCGHRCENICHFIWYCPIYK